MKDDGQCRNRGTRRTDWLSASSAGSALFVVLAVVFLAFHLPYLPASLEDLDSINFALGIRDFDVTHHQPHPPGYPVFTLIAKTVDAVVPGEARALSLVSVAAGALGVLAIAALFRRLGGETTKPRWTIAAVAVAMTTPLYWFTAVRPLSDMSGLAAALAVQAMTLGAGSSSGLAFAAFCAGLAAGLRTQVIWLTAPLLALRVLQGLGARGWGPAEGPDQLAPSLKSLAPIAASFLAGLLLWFTPLVILTGGPAAYWHALMDQGAEDLGNIQMLWNNHGARDLRDAAYYAFVAPWAAWPVAAVALTCALGGLLWLARHRRPVLIALAVAFGPYLIFDLLFQETFTGRYALPLIVPTAYLAVSGLRLLPREIGLAAAVALAMFCAHIGGTSVAAYSRTAAPAFQLLDAMKVARLAVAIVELRSPLSLEPVLAPDRRQSLDLRRPIKWVDDAPFTQILAAPPQHEWLEAVKYWNGGGRAPVWFVVDPRRTSIDLVQHGAPQAFRWALPYPVLLSGVRPDEMDWYRVDRPEWFVGEGWALTPEAAGVAEADHRGPSIAPIEGWLSRYLGGGVLMIGGRSFDPAQHPQLTVHVDGQEIDHATLAPGAFLRVVRVPAELTFASGSGYRRMTVAASSGSHVAIEQFDASATRPLLGFGDGWHEQEFNPRTGQRWRWLSERGELQLRAPAAARGLTLHVEGESPRTYFSRGSRFIIRAGDRVLLDEVLSSDFSRDVPIAAEAATIVLETDQTYMPAERSRRTQDRRHLGLRIFRAELRTQN